MLLPDIFLAVVLEQTLHVDKSLHRDYNKSIYYL